MSPMQVCNESSNSILQLLLEVAPDNENRAIDSAQSHNPYVACLLFSLACHTSLKVRNEKSVID